MSYSSGHGPDRPSDSPITMDLSDSATWPPTGLAKLRSKLARRPSLLGMSAYLAAGLCLGILLIFGLGIGRPESNAAGASTNAVTDNVVRLHSHDIGPSCWRGRPDVGPARLTVALEVGIDGKIRYASASGETPEMRSCVEAHVKSWEFLAQQQAQTMALPFEVDRR